MQIRHLPDPERPTTISKLTIGLFSSLAADSPMRAIAKNLAIFASTDASVLITGESGTGKEMTARNVHAASRRRDKSFVAVNCAALPAELIASELFGYEKGAFTGAASRKIGQIEHANGGTLFLDEIGDMPPQLQSHLLRFLQEGTISRVGGHGAEIPINVRIIAATNVNLTSAMNVGRFRKDLFFRLNVLSLHIPSLRERSSDVKHLARYFMEETANQLGCPVPEISSAAMTILENYEWPGNVRELKSTVFRAVLMCDGLVVQPEHISLLTAQTLPLTSVEIASGFRERRLGEVRDRRSSPASASLPTIDHPIAIGREALLSALTRQNENISQTAKDLRVSRVTLYRLLRRHDVVLTRSVRKFGSAPKN